MVCCICISVKLCVEWSRMWTSLHLLARALDRLHGSPSLVRKFSHLLTLHFIMFLLELNSEIRSCTRSWCDGIRRTLFTRWRRFSATHNPFPDVQQGVQAELFANFLEKSPIGVTNDVNLLPAALATKHLLFKREACSRSWKFHIHLSHIVLSEFRIVRRKLSCSSCFRTISQPLPLSSPFFSLRRREATTDLVDRTLKKC